MAEADQKLAEQVERAGADLAERDYLVAELRTQVGQLENEKGQLEVMLEAAKMEIEKEAAVALEAEAALEETGVVLHEERMGFDKYKSHYNEARDVSLRQW